MRNAFLISLFLILATVAVFWQVRNYGYVYLDDHSYVTENPHVQGGLNQKAVAWAFTSTHMGFWIPITWLSFMLDVELFGLSWGGYHLTNVLLHTANTLLLFLILGRTTQRLWRSAFVAALFALHPLRVESVVWITERKDVLSTLFWMLAMLAYVRYTESSRAFPYCFALLAFALGLMAKPILVTLPFVLLLLDGWPLGRLHLRRATSGADSQTRPERVSLPFLILEKAPFFALAVACSVVTYWAHQSSGFIQNPDTLPLGVRLANASVAYVGYIWKMFWPENLAVLYPFLVNSVFSWATVGATVLLLLVTAAVMLAAGRRPYLLVGWLWFLGTLVPNIGFVQAGAQAMADRFTYIPLIGLFLMIGWGVPDLLKRWSYYRVVSGVAATTLILVLAVCSWKQVRYWKDTITLLSHAVQVVDNNYLAHTHLGARLAQRGEIDRAIQHFSAALDIRPDMAGVQNDLGNALVRQRRFQEAVPCYSKALAIQPDYVDAHNNLAVALMHLGKFDDAILHFKEILRLKPDSAMNHNNLGIALATLGEKEEAMDHYVVALELDPKYAEAHNNLGRALAELGRLDEAAAHFAQALEIQPDYTEAHNNMGVTRVRQGRLEEAIYHFREALRLKPDFHQARINLRSALQEAQRIGRSRSSPADQLQP